MDIPHSSEANWFSGSLEPCSFDDVLDKIRSVDPDEIHIGCDSHLRQQVYFFAVAVCFKTDAGWVYFWKRYRYPQRVFPNLKLRLQHEVLLSVSLASELRDTCSTDRDTWVHADLNSNPKYKSSQSTKQLTNLIKAMGFGCLIKPCSWAASSVADWHAK